MEKEVVVTITEEENKQFTDFEDRAAAVREMLNNLTQQMQDAISGSRELWVMLHEKYNLPTTSEYFLNTKTREIMQR